MGERGLPLRESRVSLGRCVISVGNSRRQLCSRLSTLSLKSSAISGSMLLILLSARWSSSRVRMVYISLGMKESSRLLRMSSFLLLRLACLSSTESSLI